jgi:predicted GIY-YIG superfamily endonuclease
MLGYRWPEQDRQEAEEGPAIDPDLVDEDGIIPLVPCGNQPTAEQRLRTLLERRLGQQGAARSLEEFRTWVGRDLGSWLEQDFFARHIKQFKYRPIAWHLTSPEGAFQAFVLYHRISRETLQRLRDVYAGALLTRLRAELERASDDATKQELRYRIEDVEEFRTRVTAIEQGKELKHRIRCRWKGELEEGRPGPYAPDIDDGVKVNIRPFQETELLARKVIKKW